MKGWVSVSVYKRIQSNRGVTLIELLAALALIGLVLGGSYTIITQGFSFKNIIEKTSSERLDTRIINMKIQDLFYPVDSITDYPDYHQLNKNGEPFLLLPKGEKSNGIIIEDLSNQPFLELEEIIRFSWEVNSSSGLLTLRLIQSNGTEERLTYSINRFVDLVEPYPGDVVLGFGEYAWTIDKESGEIIKYTRSNLVNLEIETVLHIEKSIIDSDNRDKGINVKATKGIVIKDDIILNTHNSGDIYLESSDGAINLSGAHIEVTQNTSITLLAIGEIDLTNAILKTNDHIHSSITLYSDSTIYVNNLEIFSSKSEAYSYSNQDTKLSKDPLCGSIKTGQINDENDFGACP